MAVLDHELQQARSGYERIKLKSLYVWPDEVVWRHDWGAASTFIVFGPSPKRPDEATIYLCWSRQLRFPEQSIRPSMLLGAGGASPRTVAEGSIVVSDLGQDLPAWMHFSADRTVGEVLAPYVDILLRQGLSFLEELAMAGTEGR